MKKIIKTVSVEEKRAAVSMGPKKIHEEAKHIIDSDMQLAVYEAVKNTKQNLAILATAGSGKTTTLLRLLTKVPKSRLGIFVSFSAAIVSELQSKIPSYIEAKTLHSFGFKLIRDYFRNIKIIVVADKYFKNAVQLCKEQKADKLAYLTKAEYKECKQIESLCNYARMTLTPFNEESLKQMALHFNLEITENILKQSLFLLSKALIGKGKAMWIDFTDMIYMPVKTPAMFHTKYDDVYLDEAQDTNACQREMLENMISKKGRLISVGDDFQCIYGFSGADINAFKTIRERPNTTVLPLSVSYRLPKSGVRRAQELCKDIEAHKDAIEGIEREGHYSEIEEGNMVLSRTTKPLIGLYFELLSQRKKANIVGKDIEEGLLYFAETCSHHTKEGVLDKMDQQLEKYSASLKKLGIRYPELTPQYESMEEKRTAISIILNNIDKSSEVADTIKKIFSSDSHAVKMMTVHRAKGLECDVVFVIDRIRGEIQMPFKKAIQNWEKTQEQNLMFVSRTRHKKELVFLDLAI